MERLKYKIFDKNGSLILLMSMMLVLVLLPFLGIIVDYNNMRMFVTDVKNIQDVSGISCISHGTGNTQHIGAFTNNCNKAVQQVYSVNLAQNGSKNISSGGKTVTFTNRYQNDKSTHMNRLRVTYPSPDHFIIHSQVKDNNGFVGGKYCPIILHRKVLELLHVNMSNASWDGDCIKVYVPSTTFSATYKLNS